jgi:integrase
LPFLEEVDTVPRIPKPYPHKGWFRTNVGGKRGHPLCRIEEGMARARRLLTLHIAALSQSQESGTATRPVGSGIQAQRTADPEQGKLAGEVHDEFLDFVKVESPDSYRHYVDKLKPFVQRFGHRPIRSLTEQDGIAYKQWVLTEKEWVKGGKKEGQKSVRMKGVGPTTCNHFVRAAKTLFNWAAKPKRGYLAHNPWRDIKLLKEKPRERLITDAEFEHLLGQTSDGDFRETLFFMRYSTARPGEVRMAEWSMVDWEHHRLDFDRREVKTRNARTLTLLPEVEDMLRRRLERVRQQGGDGRGRIFLNADGGPWEPTSFSQRFRRLRDRCVRLGLMEVEKQGEKLVLYSHRHTRNVEMIRDEGLDLSMASKEMGHANITTTVRHYLHLTKQDVNDAVRKARLTSTRVMNPTEQTGVESTADREEEGPNGEKV